MGDYKKNPKVPFEIWVPNKIRKRIAMHEKDKKPVSPSRTRVPSDENYQGPKPPGRWARIKKWLR